MKRVLSSLLRWSGALLFLFPKRPPQIGKKFLQYSKPHIARHGDAEADGCIFRRV